MGARFWGMPSSGWLSEPIYKEARPRCFGDLPRRSGQMRSEMINDATRHVQHVRRGSDSRWNGGKGAGRNPSVSSGGMRSLFGPVGPIEDRVDY
jgi:hypothetical protein